MKKRFGIAGMLLVLCNSLYAQESNVQFESPEFLKVGDAPLNNAGGMMYPSPALFDIDNDGRDELVIGTIFGSVYSCENVASEGNEPEWAKPETVKSASGKALKLNNW